MEMENKIKKMRKINFIILHCSATQPNTKVQTIKDY